MQRRDGRSAGGSSLLSFGVSQRFRAARGRAALRARRRSASRGRSRSGASARPAAFVLAAVEAWREPMGAAGSPPGCDTAGRASAARARLPARVLQERRFVADTSATGRRRRGRWITARRGLRRGSPSRCAERSDSAPRRRTAGLVSAQRLGAGLARDVPLGSAVWRATASGYVLLRRTLPLSVARSKGGFFTLSVNSSGRGFDPR